MRGDAPQSSIEPLLRLLVGDAATAEWSIDRPWDTLGTDAARNGVLLQFAARLAAADALPDDAQPVIDAERARVAASLDLVHRVTRVCETHGIAHVWTSAVQHHPDIGLDVDLLVDDRSPAAASLIAVAAGLQVAPRGLSARLAGSATCGSDGGGVPLDVHLGRLGPVGEHSRGIRALIARAQGAVFGGCALRIPGDEDQMMLQGLFRVYGRRSIRLADATWAIRLIRAGRADWGVVIERAADWGILPGLGCYLCFLDQVHRRSCGTPLLSPELRGVVRHRWGDAEIRHGLIRFPAGRVTSRLYLLQIGEQLGRADLAAAGRSMLVPVVGAASAVRRGMRRVRPQPARA